MDDLFLYGILILVFLGIVYSIIASIVNKIKEPYESKARLIDLQEEKEKYSKLSVESEKKIQEAEAAKKEFERAKDDFLRKNLEAKSQLHAAQVEENRYIALKDDLIKRYNNAIIKNEEIIQEETAKRAKQIADEFIAAETAKLYEQQQLFYKRNDDLNAAINSIKFRPEILSPVLEAIDKEEYYQSIREAVLQHAFDKPFKIQDVGICAMVHSANTDEVYFTSLFDCTCKDHQYRHRPCKHTLYLAYLFGLLQIDQKERDSLVREYNITALLLEKAKIEASLCNSELSEAKLKNRALKNENDKLENCNRNIRSEVDKIIGDAIEEATRITSEARLEAARILSEARLKAARVKKKKYKITTRQKPNKIQNK